MDTGKGYFNQLSAEEYNDIMNEVPVGKRHKIPRVFSVGEELEIKGSRFKVHRIGPKKLILKLLPDSQQWEYLSTK